MARTSRIQLNAHVQRLAKEIVTRLGLIEGKFGLTLHSQRGDVEATLVDLSPFASATDDEIEGINEKELAEIIQQVETINRNAEYLRDLNAKNARRLLELEQRGATSFGNNSSP